MICLLTKIYINCEFNRCSFSFDVLSNSLINCNFNECTDAPILYKEGETVYPDKFSPEAFCGNGLHFCESIDKLVEYWNFPNSKKNKVIKELIKKLKNRMMIPEKMLELLILQRVCDDYVKDPLYKERIDTFYDYHKIECRCSQLGKEFLKKYEKVYN